MLLGLYSTCVLQYVLYNMMDFKLYMMYLYYMCENEQCCTRQFAYIYIQLVYVLYMIHSNNYNDSRAATGSPVNPQNLACMHVCD